MGIFSQWKKTIQNPWASKNDIINMALPGTAIGNAALQRNEDKAALNSANETRIANAVGEYDDGTYNPESVYAGAGPRGIASDMINAMSDDFYDENNPYSGIHLKQDLEKMTTYNGNKGILGQLQATSKAQNTANFNNALGQENRTISRFGGQLTPEQKAQQTATFAKDKALGSVDAQNRNQIYQNDLNKQLMSGLNVAPKAPGV